MRSVTSRTPLALAPFVAAAVLLAACDEMPNSPDTSSVVSDPPAGSGPPAAADHGGPFELTPPVFDIAASPDGSLVFAEFNTVKEIRQGEIRDVMTVPTEEGSAVNGLAPQGRGNYFVTSAGLDLAVGAGLWHVSHGDVRLVGDIESFEIGDDPDAKLPPAWKDQRCEAVDGFSAGPQSNPYHVTQLAGGRALVPDAAGNSLLMSGVNGQIEVVAVFTPPTDENGEWIVRFQLADETDCYVQPVPTSVAIGPDGAYYVGELTGLTLHPTTFEPVADPAGLSRVWRIEPGTRNAACPSDDCTEVLTGFTSIIDLAFGPDGKLYVAEYDEATWFAAVFPGLPTAGGTLSSCDVTGLTSSTPAADACTEEETGLDLPSAVTFDRRGNLWLLESNIVSPVVRMVDLTT